MEAKVRLHIAPAQDTLRKLLDDGQALCLKILTKNLTFVSLRVDVNFETFADAFFAP